MIASSLTASISIVRGQAFLAPFAAATVECPHGSSAFKHFPASMPMDDAQLRARALEVHHEIQHCACVAEPSA